MGQIITENIIYDNDDSMERLRKEQEYLNYINEHIDFVKKAYVLYMVPLLANDRNNISSLVSDEELKNAIRQLSLTITTHDASKFSDAEFDAYRAKYHPTKRESQIDDEEYKKIMEDKYQEAWKHHYQTNEHHPQHWVDSETGVPTDMSLGAIIEMLCDWEAMSLKFSTNTLEWYENDATDEKNAMTDKTRQIVEDLLYNVLHNTSV